MIYDQEKMDKIKIDTLEATSAELLNLAAAFTYATEELMDAHPNPNTVAPELRSFLLRMVALCEALTDA